MESDRTNLEDPWPCVEILQNLAELNEQCLELLTEQALLQTACATPVLRELVHLWCRLDPDSRRRASACPYLLVDAGFTDPYRWRWLESHRVEDREPAHTAAFFTLPGVIKLAHQVFTNAWYMARTQPACAPLFFGMPAPCAALLRGCTVRQVTEMADRYALWLRPRWAGRVSVWRELLMTAISGDEPALEKARMHGVQLLATEMRALEQVTSDERR